MVASQRKPGRKNRVILKQAYSCLDRFVHDFAVLGPFLVTCIVAGYTCVAEEGKCRARPGKVRKETEVAKIPNHQTLQVLVKSITVRTASCTGCSSEGVVVRA